VIEAQKAVAVERLKHFWAAMPCDLGPFVHPDDKSWMLDAKLAGRVRSTVPTTPDEWVEESRTTRVQLSLFPVPFLGDLKRADIIICLLNPGLEAGDFYAELRMPDFRSTIARSLRQDFRAAERYPFFFLDPQWCWTGGYRWWMKKLGDVIMRISEHDMCSFDDATSLLARRIATVELFPYHSARFDMHGALAKLPSCAEAREFVHQCIDDPDKVVVVTRQVRAWQLPERDTDRPNLIVYADGQERGAHMSPNSAGGRAILTKLGISVAA
jgi:hypothetical protein